MPGGAVLGAAAGGVGRRWVQTAVMFVVAGAAAASGVLGLTLATSSYLSFRTALTRRRPPDLAVTIKAAKVTGAELVRSRHLRGVTAAAGPYPETTITIVPAGHSAAAGGGPPQVLRVVGRSSPRAPLDNLICFTSPPGIDSCGWPTRTGEIEVASSAPVQIAPGGGRLGPVGERVTVPSVRTRPTLTVVGYAVSVLQDADAWAVPDEIAALQKAGAPRLEQMLYDFASGSGNGQVAADLAELKAALPAGAIVGSAMLGNIEAQNRSFAAQKPPLAEPFAVILLLLALLITAIVVASAVIAGYRRIGVLKGIGFTPAQVVASYLAQLALPAVAGAVAGTLLGSDWVVPLINGGPYHIHVGAPLWIKLTVPVAVCALVALAGLAPALRAARLTAVQAIAAGQAPHPAGGSGLSRLAGRLPLPRPVTIGLASAVSRPAPFAAAAAVIAFGLTGAVLAVGLDSQMLTLLPGATSSRSGGVVSSVALVHRLTLLVTIVAALGVVTTVLMLARQRVHDLGVYKAIGMTPREIIVTIVSWLIAPAIVAALIAIPAGVLLEHAVARATVNGQTGALSNVVPPTGNSGRQSPPGAGAARAGTPSRIHRYLAPRSTGARPRQIDLPSGPPGGRAPQFGSAATDVGLPPAYNPGTLALLALAGLAIAIAGAAGPATWAALSKTTMALRAE
jgi:putative ABC transport system permease protein